MKRFYLFAFTLVFFGGCNRTPFLIGGLETDYKRKVKVAAFLPFQIAPENQLAEKNRQTLEETITLWIMRGDGLHSFVFPSGIRLPFKEARMPDSQILALPPDSLGKLFSAEALLYTKIIRLYESEGPNQATREIRASKYSRRGVELLVEFRLVEAATGKLLWKYRVRRFAGDLQEVIQQVVKAAVEKWPLKQ